MIGLLGDGAYALFACIIFALVLSLSFHEFGHAALAKIFGDDTAQQAGRLTLNPIAHIDVFGLLMVIVVGFGYAKPVPTDPRNFTSRWADLFVSAAGPLMNLLLAVVSWNFFLAMRAQGVEFFMSDASTQFFVILTQVNLVLMRFNLIPVAPLDGHYIVPYLLPARLRPKFQYLNQRFGPAVLLSLIVLSVIGLPVFTWVFRAGAVLLPLITWVG